MEADEAAEKLRAAEAELRRLGHGEEVIDCITESGFWYTSHVGDPAHDTAEMRARVREASRTARIERARWRSVAHNLESAAAMVGHVRLILERVPEIDPDAEGPLRAEVEAMGKALVQINEAVNGQPEPLEFDDTVNVLCAVARSHGWTLKSWGLQRLQPEEP